MKQLLNTLYITSPDRYLSLAGETIVVQSSDEVIGKIPLHNIESIVTFGYAGASPALMGACAKRNISLSFMSRYGKFLARVTGEIKGNVALRKEQYRISDDDWKSTEIAKSFITGKIFNAKSVLDRAIRDYPDRIDGEKLKEKSKLLRKSLSQICEVKNTQQLRGIEGESATVYFSVLDDLILQQKEHFYFNNRNRRPPLDNVNAMLSFSYSLLAGMCASALETVGLDPYVGFLHKDRPGRISLALDLMEEFRAIYADRFVLTLINKKVVNESDFLTKENGAVILKDDARKRFLEAWQNKKQETIKHPFLEEKIEWGMLPYVQALLLARYIRGDLDTYPPFMWK
ncbi:MAG: type I-C CRISPR-associated endonuclease Cas1c [Oscillospiraceae bacterium]